MEKEYKEAVQRAEAKMRLEQAQSWESVFDLCIELGMDTSNNKTGQQCVLDFINSLVENR